MKSQCPIWQGRCVFLGSRYVDCPYHTVCPIARQRQELIWRNIRRGFERREAIRKREESRAVSS